MLRIDQIHTYHGESHILQGISLNIEKGECVALLGPNGMGKTTTLRSIMGLTPPRRGMVRFKNHDVTRLPPFRIARLGISYVPEERGIFGSLTVLQNLKIPFLNLRRHDDKKWREIENRIYMLFPPLRGKEKQLAGTLSGGEQQMLATARALILGEQLVLLDEPTEGLAPVVIQVLVATIHAVKAQGQTMLLVEQNIHTAMDVADRCYFLEKGHIKLEERVVSLREKPDLLHRYLGI